MKVVKRNKEIVQFNSIKILNAIKNAFQETGEVILDSDLMYVLRNILDDIEEYVELHDKDIIDIETIQNIVERRMMKDLPNYTKTTRAYILYRGMHKNARETNTDLMKAMHDFTFKSAAELDDKRDNANINTDTAMGTMLKYGTTTSNHYTDNYILPKDIAKAHINGDIHIHDKDFYMLTETCCQINLKKLFDKGFDTGHGTVRTPNSIQSYASLACVVIQANQNEMHGGQAIPAFDYYMAPGVLKTFKKEYKKAFLNMITAFSKEDAEKNYDTINSYVESVKNIDCKNDGFYFAINYIELKDKAYDIAIKETEKATYQAMQILIHNLNTLHSRAGKLDCRKL